MISSALDGERLCGKRSMKLPVIKKLEEWGLEVTLRENLAQIIFIQ